MERSKSATMPFGARRSRPSPGRRLARLALWALAVPALCAGVIVGGAVPLYLLLPEKIAQPDAVASTPAARETNAGDVPAEQVRVAAREPEAPVASPNAPEVADDAPVVDTEPTGAVPRTPDAFAAPPPSIAVVPTPRPAAPVPAATPGPEREVAVLEQTPRKPVAAPPRMSTRSTVIRRTVNLRAGPWGRKLGVIDAGTAVVVARCEDWCEVSAGNTRGWVHPSFIAGTGRAPERRLAAPVDRSVERGARAETRRESDWLRRERQRVYAEGLEREPIPLEAQEPPFATRRRPPPIEYYDVEPYDFYD